MTAEAGWRQVDLTSGDDALPVIALYPSTSDAQEVRVGPYTLTTAIDGDLAPGRHPVVAISHGSGGTPLTHRTRTRRRSTRPSCSMAYLNPGTSIIARSLAPATSRS